MKKIFVRKIFPYDPTFGGECSRYDGYDLTTRHMRDPEISSSISVKLPETSKPAIIYCSNLKRGKETAAEIADKLGTGEVISTDLLREIMFDLKKLLTRGEFEKEGSSLVRERFIEAFIDDSLEESREEIKDRIDQFLGKLRDLPDGNYLVVSHSFFMKILETYQNEPDLFKDPAKLARYLDASKRTYEHGKGFDLVLA